MVATILLIIGYVVAMLVLAYINVLSKENLILTFSTALGWLVALSIAIINLNKARKNNKEAKDYETKKKIEIDAFKEVNKATNVLSNKLISVNTFFLSTLPNHLKNHLMNPTLFKYDPIKMDLERGRLRVELYEGMAAFHLTIEANEIAVLEFDHYKKYVGFQVEDLHKLFDDFDAYSSKLFDLSYIRQPQAYAELKSKCDNIWEFAWNILGYLFDYRILIMNAILTDIFGRSVPPRKPTDSNIKILSEVAVKEEVEKEADRRAVRSIL